MPITVDTYINQYTTSIEAKTSFWKPVPDDASCEIEECKLYKTKNFNQECDLDNGTQTTYIYGSDVAGFEINS